MDYETILERARTEAGAEFIAAFARDLAYERCEVYEAMSYRTTNIVRFQCGTFEYLYDDYASLEQRASSLPGCKVAAHIERRPYDVCGERFQVHRLSEFIRKNEPVLWIATLAAICSIESIDGHSPRVPICPPGPAIL
jgi:hypothetical protein